MDHLNFIYHKTIEHAPIEKMVESPVNVVEEEEEGVKSYKL